MFTIGWALAAVVGSLAGLLVAPSVFVGPNQFDSILIYGFVAAVLGGLDSPLGAIVGGVILGLVLSYVSGYEGSALAPLAALVVLVTTLMVRPSGLFSRTGATSVSGVQAREELGRPKPSGVPSSARGRRSRASRWWRRHTLVRSLTLLVGTLLVLILLSEGLSEYRDLQLADAAYYFAVLGGLTVLIGLSGQISLGHGALMAVGAYTVALLIANEHWPLLPALLMSVVVTALVGVLVGAAASRLRGPYLAGATLAFAVGLPGLAYQYPETFGGANGIATIRWQFPPSSARAFRSSDGRRG